jgi:hypothetical protein
MELQDMPPVGRATTAVKYEWVERLLASASWPEGECILWPFGSPKTERAPQWALVAVIRATRGAPPSFACSNKLHSCGEPLCLNPNHLYWGTHSDNSEDKARHGRTSVKLDREKARLIRAAVLEGGFTQGDVALEFGVSRQTVHNIIHNHSWKETA